MLIQSPRRFFPASSASAACLAIPSPILRVGHAHALSRPPTPALTPPLEPDANPRSGPPVKYHVITRLHQIVIVDGLKMPEHLSPSLLASIDAFKQLYPAAVHTLWSGEMLRDYVYRHLGADVLSAFDALKPYAYKCDLARYCLLYVEGGLYSDLGLQHLAPWRVPSDAVFSAFNEIYGGQENKFNVSNGLLWSQPGACTLEIAINRIVDNCRAGFYGTCRLDPTGPGLLGWACATVYSEQWQRNARRDQHLGLTAFQVDGERLGMTFTPTDERDPIACRIPRVTSDNRYIGDVKTNNYALMWDARDIYK